MINFRLYRLAFLPAVLALVVAMFSLEGAPEALEAVDPPTTFEGDRAFTVARQIASTAPDRTPGSRGDEAIADLVVNRFEDVPAGAVSEQRFEAPIDGEDVSLRNVLLTLPGDSAETVVITAARDSADGPGAAASAAATGILVELANALRVSHEKTYVLASTTGSTPGAAGIRALVDGIAERDAIEAAIVIFQPGAGERRSPFVVASSAGESSPSAQLVRTAEEAVSIQAGGPTASEGAFTQLARLALPSGLGDQAPLIADGLDAIAITSAGERPLSVADAAELSDATVDEFGRAVQSTIDALDDAVAGPTHGPGSYLELGDNLLPGWTLALLALALLAPAVVAAVDACAREARQGVAVGRALAWSAARSLPFIGALAALYALALLGAIPRPEFPFDPGFYELGARAAISFAVIALVAAASAWLIRGRATARRAPEAASAALGAVTSLACLALWIANPYLALLTVAAAHVWVLACGPRTTIRRALVVVGALAACVLPAAALVAVADALALGADSPWIFTLMVADGQIGLLTTLAASLIAGSLLALAALALRRGPPEPL